MSLTLIHAECKNERGGKRWVSWLDPIRFVNLASFCVFFICFIWIFFMFFPHKC